jgi:hypothetical protein
MEKNRQIHILEVSLLENKKITSYLSVINQNECLESNPRTPE